MKKLMTALTICAVASFATATDVTSPNIVGYTTDGVTANKYIQIAPAFVGVGNAAALGVNQLLKGNFQPGDQLMIWDVGAQALGTFLTWGEAYDPETDLTLGINAWTDENSYYSSLTLTPGTGLWLNTSGGAAVQFNQVGQVDVAPKSLTIQGDGFYSIIANPYPVTVLVNSKTWTGFQPGDQLMFWDIATQALGTFLTWGEAYDPETDLTLGINAWTDENSYYSVLPLEIGRGFWVCKTSAGSGTVQF